MKISPEEVKPKKANLLEMASNEVSTGTELLLSMSELANVKSENNVSDPFES